MTQDQIATAAIQTPHWVKNAVFYQIFPDRFRRSPRTPLPRGITFKPWGTPPVEQGFQGGDLYGVAEKLDYLADLGITAIYLNPIFSSASNHRYHAFDYLKVDPLLGGDEALHELLTQAHHRGMRVILDGVFNHASRGFWPFHHILENGPDSPYLDWFHITGWPLRPYNTDASHPINYSAWWGLPALPKLNTANEGVRDLIFQVARHWLEFGVDGWRLDVPAEIDDDDFWREFRQVVKTANPDAYIVGEIWHEARRWLQGDMFDAVMNYQFTAPVLNFFGGDSLTRDWSHPDIQLRSILAEEFRARIENMFGYYAWEINHAQMNMLDSHDMPRALWLLNDEIAAFKQVVLCQMTMPGAPCVYYGDEIGLSAAGDPHCRGAFPWDNEQEWNRDLHDFYRAVIRLRTANPALSEGEFEFLSAKDRTVSYRRTLEPEEFIILFNTGKRRAQMSVPTGHQAVVNYTQAYPQGGQTVIPTTDKGVLTLRVPGQSGLVLRRLA